MEVETAKEVVASLANGIDPITGEVFDDQDPYSHPTIIRALYTVLNHVRMPKRQTKLTIEEKREQNIREGKPGNAGLAWTGELKQEVAELFKQGKTTYELAQHFERTEGAIISELTHQGLIDQSEPQNCR